MAELRASIAEAQPFPTGSLVERVAQVVFFANSEMDAHDAARAAIREVAAWLNLPAIAAAIEKLADQVVPNEPDEAMHFTNEAIRLNRMSIRTKLLAIAAELEDQ
jgi:hypothetical protein